MNERRVLGVFRHSPEVRYAPKAEIIERPILGASSTGRCNTLAKAGDGD